MYNRIIYVLKSNIIFYFYFNIHSIETSDDTKNASILNFNMLVVILTVAMNLHAQVITSTYA